MKLGIEWMDESNGNGSYHFEILITGVFDWLNKGYG